MKYVLLIYLEENAMSQTFWSVRLGMLVDQFGISPQSVEL